MGNDLYYLKVDGERIDFDGHPNALPWHDALHCMQGAFGDGAKEVTLVIKERRNDD
jgi:hypothetical protein